MSPVSTHSLSEVSRGIKRFRLTTLMSPKALQVKSINILFAASSARPAETYSMVLLTSFLGKSSAVTSPPTAIA